MASTRVQRRKAIRTAFKFIIVALLVAGLCLGGGSLLAMAGCASVPGHPSPASVAAQAATDGLAAYRTALAAGAGRDAALVAARDAAVASALALVPGAVDAEYRPFVTLALEALILTAKGPESLPPEAKVGEAIEDAITEAEIRRGIVVKFGTAKP